MQKNENLKIKIKLNSKNKVDEGNYFKKLISRKQTNKQTKHQNQKPLFKGNGVCRKILRAAWPSLWERKGLSGGCIGCVFGPGIDGQRAEALYPRLLWRRWHNRS